MIAYTVNYGAVDETIHVSATPYERIGYPMKTPFNKTTDILYSFYQKPVNVNPCSPQALVVLFSSTIPSYPESSSTTSTNPTHLLSFTLFYVYDVVSNNNPLKHTTQPAIAAYAVNACMAFRQD